jgi:hypothetical protein
MSVDTTTTCPTGTGPDRKIHESIRCSMAVRRPYLGMALSLLTGMLLAYLLIQAAISDSSLQTAEAVSLLAHSQSKHHHTGTVRTLFANIDTSTDYDSWTIYLRPVQTIWKKIPPNPQTDGLGYNPRCLSHELSPQASMNTTEANVISLVLNILNITSFQDAMQCVVPGDLGVHGGGHYGIRRDANGDLYNSPSNPAFFAHHAMIDRTWWI